MKAEEDRLCRLCLRADSSEIFEEIGETIKEILEVLQLKLNFHINEEHVCSSCMENIQRCFDFKSTCWNVENCILPFYSSENECKLDLREMYKQENMNTATGDIPEDQEICRFCMKLNKSSSCKPLTEIENDILEKCTPELNFNMTKEPVICNSCQNSLQFYSQLLQTCVENEEKITKNCKFKANGSEGQINLNEVLQFEKNMLEYEGDIAKTNAGDLDELRCETKENDVIKTEIIVKRENEEFDRDDVETDIKTNVEENIIKEEIKEESVKLEDEELDINCEHKWQTEQNDFESFRDAPASSQLIMRNTNICNPKEQMVTEQVTAENLENLDDIKSANNHRNPSKETTYKCEICSFVTKYKTHLKSHILIHRSSDRCSFKTKHKNSLKMHTSLHQEISKITVYKCESCAYVTKCKSHFDSHNEQIHRSSQEALYNCVRCSFTTKYKSDLKSHMLMVHQELSDLILYKCQSCSYMTNNKNVLNTHNRLIHPSEHNLYKCYQCSFKTKYKICLKRHMLTHQELSEPTLYKCESCSYVTKNKNSLNTHNKRLHQSEGYNVHNCDKCSFKTVYKISLKRHMLTHQELSEVTVYTCKKCSYITKLKDNLKSHMLVHQELSEVTLYKCDFCSFTTKRRASVNEHMMMHRPSEVTVYYCHQCSFNTERKRSLKHHMMTHRKLQKKQCLSVETICS